MKAIVLAILLLTPAIVLSPCATNGAASANVASPACATCVSALGQANAVAACATCTAGNKLTSTQMDCDACPIATYAAAGNNA